MYVPSAFREENSGMIHDFIEAHSLGALITAEGGLFASHLPFVLDREGSTLRGHLARANPQVRSATDEAGRAALVIFSGPDAYISPGWYPSKAKHGKVVPTWNYVAVHAVGTLRLIEDPAFIVRNLEELTARHESAQARPWSLKDAPDGFIDALVRAVIGVEIAVERFEGKWKMSQNRPGDDIDGAMYGLMGTGDPAAREVAGLMETLKPVRPERS